MSALTSCKDLVLIRIESAFGIRLASLSDMLVFSLVPSTEGERVLLIFAKRKVSKLYFCEDCSNNVDADNTLIAAADISIKYDEKFQMYQSFYYYE